MTHKIGYRPEIDGLRAFAVLSVLFYHLGFSWIPGGFLGVDIFFVISGYLITSIIIKELRQNEFSLANFYARRIKRIFPALIFVLFGCAVMAFLFHEPHSYKELFRAIKYTSLQVSNFFFMNEVDYFNQDLGASALLHTWSLGVEEQFYLFWPLILIVLYKKLGIGRAFVMCVGAIFLASLFISEYLLKDYPMHSFYMLYSRAWELLIGAAIALGLFPQLKRKWNADVLSVASIALLIFTVSLYSHENFPGLKAFLPCFAAGLFIYSAQHQQGLIHRFFSLKPFVFTGLISYSMYLWHWPLIRFYESYTGISMTLPVQLSIIVLTFVMGYISYRFVEQPYRHLKTPPKKVIAVGLLIVVAIAFSTNLLRRPDNSTIRVTQAVDEQMFAYSPVAKSCFIREGKKAPAAFSPEQFCTFGDENAEKRAILIGDSHAGHYSEMVKAWAEANNVHLTLFMQSGRELWLYPVDDSNTQEVQAIEPDRQRVRKKFHTFINEQKEKGLHYDYAFLGLRADYIYGLYQTLSDDEKTVQALFDRDIQKGYDNIKNIADKIILLGQVPIFEGQPLECFYKAQLLISSLIKFHDAEKCITLDKEYSENLLRPAREILSRDKIYFDPTPTIYDAMDNKKIIFPYKDDDHLNPTGALFLVEPFSDFMRKHK